MTNAEEHINYTIFTLIDIWLLQLCRLLYSSIFDSFVRSVTMDKWKDTELEKMKIGGNRSARVFFEMQTDYDDKMSLQEKYNSRAAALYRDKV